MFRKLAAISLAIVALLAAGWLALRRPDIPYQTLENRYALEQSRFVTAAGNVKIHYTDTGPRDAPVVVLVHGYAASLHTWLPWQKRLSTNYRVITLDLPGHGLSRVPEDPPVSIEYFVDVVDSLTRKLDIGQFSLAGSSMGGNVAWQYARAHPGQLDSLILVDAAGWPAREGEADSSPMVFKLLRWPVARLLMRDLDMTGLIEDGLRKSFIDQTHVTAEMAERYSALSRAPGHRDVLLRLAASGPDREKASRETLSAIDVPTLIIWGEEDKLIPVSHAERFKRAIPNAVAITYPAGHVPQEEVAARSAGDVSAFLDRHASGTPARGVTQVNRPASTTVPAGADTSAQR